MAVHEKDLEILLHEQLAILDQHRKSRATLSKSEKLKALSRRTMHQLNETLLLFKPRTVFNWHRELVARKWAFHRTNVGGRPRKPREFDQMIVRLALENPELGFGNLQGELLKLAMKFVRRRLPRC
jgi:hypothetical protein